ncbi:MAG TPA: class I SAM-dependent methyltransferase [Thermoplasmata archaeon]|nr:class I SAM-dependent methyltransferase [Thermoplasmata archaeon]
MAELNALARWHVNAFARRRNARRYAWVRENLSLAPGAACLEIGCGNGGMAALLVEGLRPARWVATDLDPRQIQLAHRTLARRYPDGLPPSLELRTADMLQLPFPRGSFDAVFAFAAIHHASQSHHDFSRLPDALTELDRVLRGGGFLVYEEIVHQAKIRGWLLGRGYTLCATRRRWRRELNVAQKAG